MIENQCKINLDSVNLNEEQFFQICQNNRDLRIERNQGQELVIMPPTGGETSDQNSELNFQLRLWNKQYKLGKVFESSGGFILGNGANRSPDASWIPLEKWNQLTSQQRQRFLPLSPDFVVKLRSPSDNWKSLQAKMKEYIDNGTKLGWLIDPQNRQVEIYRPETETEILYNPHTLSGEDVLPNFILDLELIFSPQ